MTNQSLVIVEKERRWLGFKLKPTKRYFVVGKALLYTTAAFGSLGDGLHGYDSGIMAGLLVNPVFLDRFFADYGASTGSIDPNITGIAVGCLQLSAAVGALISGRVGDMIGRKRCVRIGAFIYLFTAFIQMFAPNFAAFVAGRTIQGIGVGFLSMTVPIIQTEIAAPHRRGLMVGIEFTFLISGYALSCWVDYGFNYVVPSNLSWQGPFIVQAVLSFILFSMSFMLPETPRWLAANGFPEECVQTIADLHANGNTDAEVVKQIASEIQEAVRYESTLGRGKFSELFTRYRKRTIVALTVQAFAQLNGINVISFYLPSSLASAGFSPRKALLYTAANAIPYVAATVAAWGAVDRWGRRPMLITGGCVMAVMLAIVCAFVQADLDPLTAANGQYAFVLLYNLCYGFFWGPVPWLLPAEVFPLRNRSQAVALATFNNWCFNFIIGMSSPSAFAGIGGYYYLIIAGFCLMSAALAKWYYVETAGHTLEEMAVLFGDKAFMDEEEDAGKCDSDVGDVRVHEHVDKI